VSDGVTLQPGVQPDAALPTNAQRDGRGRLLPGNTLALRTGLYSERSQAEYQDEVDRFLAASLADDGGVAEVSTRRRTVHEYRARVDRRIRMLDAALEARGLFDCRGRLRVAWISKLESLIATARALDSLLGLDRRQRPIRSLSEALAQAQPAEVTRADGGEGERPSRCVESARCADPSPSAPVTSDPKEPV
jgi:hypothetical protein